ncbi:MULTISPECIES: polyprenyl synthetase family protein [Thermomonosporaceae]|uniref:polyprenyl synthetase family protein n=1 Tax=Thermomonosporaceae TaxID=2012 RepID=UPI00255B2440|nr:MULTISPECIES: polyprenyl synthetase family protein [Thermomonosporaceae]MDL4773060.1 polyprenyl synthetase family protein [Actinomadura xylanilytica]
MATTPLRPAALDLTEIRDGVDAVLYGFLDDLCPAGDDGPLPVLAGTVRTFLGAGGKRIRPLLCMIGWHAGGGAGEPAAALRLAAALELFHAAVLMHDDVIDESPTRRGRPTVHHVLAEHRRAGPDLRFGTSAAIILGDLTLAWSDQLVRSAGMPADRLQDVLPVLEAMRTEVNLGQFLDLVATGRPTADLEAALTIARYKTAHYTVQRPLQAGAALAGASPDVLAACSAFGIPLGEAFQLRDDLLGVFGDPSRTGKPVVSDLREGKHTPLIALALRRAGSAQSATLHARLGNPRLDEAGAAEVRRVLSATGAPGLVEQMIAERHAQALDVLAAAPFRPAAADALRAMADIVVRRTG